MSVTMVDVARVAGVNKATVSRVLKGDPRISTATAEKVWKVVKELGYQPNVVAKGLSCSRTDTVAAVFEDLSRPWVGAFLAGLDRVLAAKRQVVMVFSTGGDSGSRGSVSRSLKARRVDGVIWVDPVPTVPEGVTCLTVGSLPVGEASIVLDHEAALGGLRKLAAGRRLLYRGGGGGSFAGLDLTESEGAQGAVMHVYDGLFPALPLERPAVYCGDSVVAGALGCHGMEWPWFDIGVLAGRIIFNRIQGKGVRPDQVSVPPRFTPFIKE